MRFKPASITLVLLILCTIQIESSNSLAQEDAGVRLEEILKKTGDYCEKVKTYALHYVCNESILNTIYYYRTVQESGTIPNETLREATMKLEFTGEKKESWTYDYQLIRKSGEMTESRNLLEENGRTKIEPDATLKNLKYSSKYIVFGPVGFLSKYWQKHFSYEIVRSENIANRKAVVIKASPKHVRAENYNVGHIWIDAKDFSILRIQWEPVSIQNYEKEGLRLPIGKYKKTVVWNVDFEVERKGIRFPSLQTIQELIIEDGKKRHLLEKTEFTYNEYKFFTVETDVKY